MLYYNPRHVSSNNFSSSGGQNCIITAYGIVTLGKWLYSTPVESGLHSALNRHRYCTAVYRD